VFPGFPPVLPPGGGDTPFGGEFDPITKFGYLAATNPIELLLSLKIV